MIKGKCKIHYFKEVPNTPQTYHRQDGSIIVMLRANRPTRSYSVHRSVDTGIHPTLNTRGVTVWGRRSAIVRQS
jgi:hypothetical protein